MSIHTNSKVGRKVAAPLIAILMAGTSSIALADGHMSSNGKHEGVYLGGGLGLSMPNDPDVDSTTAYDLDLEGGAGGLLNLGYAYGNGLRAELEANYFSNDADSAQGVSANGDVDATGLFVNALYDMDLGLAVTPYVGVGLGYLDLDAGVTEGTTNTALSGDGSGLGYQGILGASLPLNDHLQAFADYRYIAGVERGGFDLSGASADMDYSSHNFMLGLRYFFNAPKAVAKPAPQPVAEVKPQPVAKPAPKPVPKPEPKPEPVALPSAYIVFFDFDSTDLTAEAQAILQAAATNAPGIKHTVIELTGHADLSGATAYNLGLSQRRANIVREELIRLGVPAAEISTAALGESAPLVPTDNGVREPQNRRVEIIFK